MSKIIRSKRDTPFVQIDKTGPEDQNLSWKAKGILAYILCKPDDWDIYLSELSTHAKDGKDSTASGVNELIKAGYIERKRMHDENGKFAGYDYRVFEKPTVSGKPGNGESSVSGKTVSGLSVNGKTVSGKPATTNNNSTNNDLTNNEKTNKEDRAKKFAPPSDPEKTFEELAAKAKKITATQSGDMPHGDEELTQLKSEKPKRKKVAPSTNGFVLIQLTNIEIEKHMEITLSRLPEANIQAEFYHICKKNAVNCILEYTYNGSRFDALVYDDKRRAVVIVEFKSYKTDKHPKTKTKQLKKYQQFGLPIVLVTRIEDVEWAFKECLKHIPIKEVAKAEPKEPSLFTLAKDSFTEWHKKHSPGVEMYWDRKEIGQLAQMIKRLQHEAKASNFVALSDQDFIEKIFDPFCKKYINSKEWFSDSFTPASIVSKWNVIVQALRNPKTKAPSIQKIDNTKYDKYIKAAQDGTLTKAFTK